KKLKNNKAPGIDRIRNEMLKCGQQTLVPCISKIFNLILDAGVYPDVWTRGIISAIYKSGDKSDPSDYRGICVTSCLGKLFCFILNNRLQTFLTSNQILHQSQIGFLSSFRTSDHI
ncbi:predicted protein, partial [Nematostella vectensis]